MATETKLKEHPAAVPVVRLPCVYMTQESQFFVRMYTDLEFHRKAKENTQHSDTTIKQVANNGPAAAHWGPEEVLKKRNYGIENSTVKGLYNLDERFPPTKVDAVNIYGVKPDERIFGSNERISEELTVVELRFGPTIEVLNLYCFIPIAILPNIVEAIPKLKYLKLHSSCFTAVQTRITRYIRLYKAKYDKDEVIVKINNTVESLTIEVDPLDFTSTSDALLNKRMMSNTLRGFLRFITLYFRGLQHIDMMVPGDIDIDNIVKYFDFYVVTEDSRIGLGFLHMMGRRKETNPPPGTVHQGATAAAPEIETNPPPGPVHQGATAAAPERETNPYPGPVHQGATVSAPELETNPPPEPVHQGATAAAPEIKIVNEGFGFTQAREVEASESYEFDYYEPSLGYLYSEEFDGFGILNDLIDECSESVFASIYKELDTRYPSILPYAIRYENNVNQPGPSSNCPPLPTSKNNDVNELGSSSNCPPLSAHTSKNDVNQPGSSSNCPSLLAPTSKNDVNQPGPSSLVVLTPTPVNFDEDEFENNILVLPGDKDYLNFATTAANSNSYQQQPTAARAPPLFFPSKSTIQRQIPINKRNSGTTTIGSLDFYGGGKSLNNRSHHHAFGKKKPVAEVITIDEEEEEDENQVGTNVKENGSIIGNNSNKGTSTYDDLQILSEKIISPPRDPYAVNSLELETRPNEYRDRKWLVERLKTIDENPTRRKSQIDYELKTLQVLKQESSIGKDICERIRRSLTITDVITLEPTPPVFPEITDEMSEIINRALKLRNDSEVLTTAFNIQITRADLKTLLPCQWLNDNVINTYMDMIAHRSKNSLGSLPSVYVFITFFYPKFQKEGYSNILKSWTRKVDIFSYDLLIFPIHLGIHWCLAAADLRKKQITFYDSLLGNHVRTVKALLKYLASEMKERKKIELIPGEWKLDVPKDIPTQANFSDCGVFTCKFAEYLSRDAPLTFSQENMNYFRSRMVYEIIKQDLLYP